MRHLGISKEMTYHGDELRSCFAYEQDATMLGDTITSFSGPAEVKEHLVDLEDVKKDDYISSEYMMHFIVEIHDIGVREAVLWQRTLINIIIEKLRKHIKVLWKDTITRKGDDIMVNDRKLSVSIATRGVLSGLIHVGLNLKVGDNCPVEAIGLVDEDLLTLDITGFRHLVAMAFIDEFNDIKRAGYKVVSR